MQISNHLRLGASRSNIARITHTHSDRRKHRNPSNCLDTELMIVGKMKTDELWYGMPKTYNNLLLGFKSGKVFGENKSSLFLLEEVDGLIDESLFFRLNSYRSQSRKILATFPALCAFNESRKIIADVNSSSDSMSLEESSTSLRKIKHKNEEQQHTTNKNKKQLHFRQRRSRRQG